MKPATVLMYPPTAASPKVMKPSDARGDETGHVDHGAHALGKDGRVSGRLLVVLTVLALVGEIIDCGLQSRWRCMLSILNPLKIGFD